MSVWRWLAPLVLICLLIFTVGVENAPAHRRRGLPLVRAIPPAAVTNSTSQGEKASGPLSLEPDSYWQKLLAQEKAGDLEEAWKTGMDLVNLFPQASQRGAALLKLADLARGKGEVAQALELYGLVRCLLPDTPEAAQARLAAHVLELSRDVSQGDPLQALRRFLEKVATLPAGYSPETLQEALRCGWQAVCQKVRADAPPPLSLVEEILALWDLQPQGVGPPEAACLLADLLREYGLLEEARTILTQRDRKSRAERGSKLQAQGLELAWLSKDWPGIAACLEQVPEGEENQKLLLRSWLTRWQAGVVESSAIVDEALLSWFMPPKAYVWWEGQLPTLEQGLKYLAAPPFPSFAKFQAGLAQRYWAQSHFSPTAQMHQLPANKPLRVGLTPFYQDRLGLDHLKSGETDAAQKTYQELAQHNDPFWRRLAQVRLADLELFRLQTEPSP
jgi:tetratricopeptide (TPR) repeat protein